MKIKVNKLSTPQGLIVTVPILNWADGIRALITEAKKLDITPECIACEKLDETGEETTLSITLWGAR